MLLVPTYFALCPNLPTEKSILSLPLSPSFSHLLTQSLAKSRTTTPPSLHHNRATIITINHLRNTPQPYPISSMPRTATTPIITVAQSPCAKHPLRMWPPPSRLHNATLHHYCVVAHDIPCVCDLNLRGSTHTTSHHHHCVVTHIHWCALLTITELYFCMDIWPHEIVYPLD